MKYGSDNIKDNRNPQSDSGMVPHGRQQNGIEDRGGRGWHDLFGWIECE
jgi:hypothetical protein